MLSNWLWISRCGDYWQQAELRTDGACRIMMMMMCSSQTAAGRVDSVELRPADSYSSRLWRWQNCWLLSSWRPSTLDRAWTQLFIRRNWRKHRLTSWLMWGPHESLESKIADRRWRPYGRSSKCDVVLAELVQNTQTSVSCGKEDPTIICV